MKAYRGTVNNLQLDQIIIKFNWIEWAKKVHKLYPDPGQLQCITNRQICTKVFQENLVDLKNLQEGVLREEYMYGSFQKLSFCVEQCSGCMLSWLYSGSTVTNFPSNRLTWTHLSSLELTFKIWKRALKGQTRASPSSLNCLILVWSTNIKASFPHICKMSNKRK